MSGEKRGALDEKKGRVVALATELGSISAACRQLGLDRSTYYRLRQGATNSRAIPAHVEQTLLDLCLQYPEWGCDRLAYYLTLTGNRISSPTTQKILIRHGLARIKDRMAACKGASAT